jgi:hypothetical protein
MAKMFESEEFAALQNWRKVEDIEKSDLSLFVSGFESWDEKIF